MLFFEETPSECALRDLATEVGLRPVPASDPLPCDRWIARSALQKAIRRAEPASAQRALANLFLYDRRSAWRALIIIALEDLGAVNVKLLAQIVAAYRDRAWRTQMGGEGPALTELVRQMAESLHCQVACDLLLCAMNDPAQEAIRAAALESAADSLASKLWDCDSPLLERAVAALALSGELAQESQCRDPAAVFDVLSDTARCPYVVARCREAWKISRNPMSLLLPLVREQFMLAVQDHTAADDSMPAVQLTSGVPGYALDQFTRRGNAVSRALLAENADLRDVLDAASIRRSEHLTTVGI